jgi:hypothetical protein
MKMERTKDARKNRKMERHETPVFTPMRDNPASPLFAIFSGCVYD